MKSLALAALLSLLIMQPLTAADMAPQYTVEIKVHVVDSQALCKRAFDAALPLFGLAVAERFTLDEHGEWNVPGCVAVAYQLEKFGGTVQSVGLEIKAVER